MRLKTTLALLGIAMGSSVVRAGDAVPTVSIQQLPPQCRAFTWLPTDAEDTTLAWNQLLSLASCLQDASIEHVSNADELAPMVSRFEHGLAIPMTIYLRALEDGPGDVQLRAAYQLGMAQVALIVRARSSLVNPALGPRLEPVLARSLRFARMTFSVIDRAVAEDPTLATDAVTWNMVRSARAMLRVLPAAPADEQSFMNARL